MRPPPAFEPCGVGGYYSLSWFTVYQSTIRIVPKIHIAINLTKYGAKVMKNALNEFTKKFGEGTAFDLDWGKLLIIGLLCYHIFFQTN